MNLPKIVTLQIKVLDPTYKKWRRHKGSKTWAEFIDGMIKE